MPEPLNREPNRSGVFLFPEARKMMFLQFLRDLSAFPGNVRRCLWLLTEMDMRMADVTSKVERVANAVRALKTRITQESEWPSIVEQLRSDNEAKDAEILRLHEAAAATSDAEAAEDVQQGADLTAAQEAAQAARDESDARIAAQVEADTETGAKLDAIADDIDAIAPDAEPETPADETETPAEPEPDLPAVPDVPAVPDDVPDVPDVTDVPAEPVAGEPEQPADDRTI